MKTSDKVQLLLRGIKLSEIKELEEQEKKENEEIENKKEEKERSVLEKQEKKFKDDEKSENKEDEKDSDIKELKKNFTELKELITSWQEKNISDVNTEDEEEKTTADKVEDIANRLFN